MILQLPFTPKDEEQAEAIDAWCIENRVVIEVDLLWDKRHRFHGCTEDMLLTFRNERDMVLFKMWWC